MAIAEDHYQALFERSRALLMPQIDEESGMLRPNAALPFDVDSIDDDPRERPYEIEDGEATIRIEGVIGFRVAGWLKRWFGMCDLADIQQMVAEAEEDDAVEQIRYYVDSPGGAVTGLEETVRMMIAGQKPSRTVVDALAASAGYFLGAAADRFETTRSARVGSIGTIYGHYDWSGYYAEAKVKPIVYRSGDFKAPGFLHGEKITEKQQKEFQERLMAVFRVHDELLSETRPQLDAEWRQGQVLRGSEAWPVGMVDDLVAPPAL